MQEHNTGRTRKPGFNLAELLVVVVVIGVLTAMAIAGLHGLTKQSSSASCDLTMSAAVTATAMYYAHARRYPQTFAELTDSSAGRPWLDLRSMTATATSLRSNNGWTLRLVAGATPSDPTSFIGCS